MSKYLKVAIACATMLAVALPALALENKINGYFRVQGVGGTEVGAPAADKSARNVVDTRLRVKWTANVNDNAGFVYYGEVDTNWGNTANGGALGADGKQLQTKNSYMFFNAGGVNVKAGIMGFNTGHEGTYIFHDAAGLQISKSFGDTKVTALWSKFAEGTLANSKSLDDDRDFYGVIVAPKLGAVKLNVGLFLDDNDTQGALGGPGIDQQTITLALGAGFKVGGMGLDVGLQKQFDQGEGYLFVAKLATGFGDFRLINYGDDSDAVADESFNGGVGAYEFYKCGLSIFLTDAYYNNEGTGRHALTDAAYAGYGLTGLVFTGKQDMGDFYVKYAAGYFTAMSDEANDSGVTKEGKDLGLEIAAQVGTKLAEKVDLSIRGAYAMLGSFYDAAAGGSDPDDMYTTAIMLNMGF